MHRKSDPIENSDGGEEAAMKTVGFRKVRALDGVRGVAILTVMIFHLPKPAELQWYVRGGFLGVDIFFVLSGFLITSILLDEYRSNGRLDLKNFFIRRFLRLAPAFWLYLIVLYVFGQYLMTGTRFEETFRGHNFAFSFLYLLNWSIALRGQDAGNLNQIWSLAIEEQFYILWAVGLYFMLRWQTRPERIALFTLGSVTLVVLWRAARTAYGVNLNILYYSTDTRIDSLLVGCAASMLYMWNLIPAKIIHGKIFVVYTLLAIAVGTAIIFSFSHQDQTFYYGFASLFAVAVATTILFLLTHSKTWLHRILESSMLTGLGLISYGVYLWHYLAFEYGRMIFNSRSVRYLSGISLALALPILSFYLIEKPFLKLKNQFSSRRRSLVQPTADSRELKTVSVVYQSPKGIENHDRGENGYPE